MENLEFKRYVFYEELTQILFYLEDMMTHKNSKRTKVTYKT